MRVHSLLFVEILFEYFEELQNLQLTNSQYTIRYTIYVKYLLIS